MDPATFGYEVTAFITLEIRQAGGHDPVAERLAAIPEVLEVHTITGAGDMLCGVVALTYPDLQRVLDAIVSADGGALRHPDLPGHLTRKLGPGGRAVANPGLCGDEGA